MSINQTLEEMEQGWHRDGDTYYCNYCETAFVADQVYQFGDQFYAAAPAIRHHITDVHGGNAQQLIHADTKYNQLTKKQQELLDAFANGEKDAAVAKALGVSASTIRHQKFTFREKAKQALQYLAMYHNVFEVQPDSADSLIPTPGHVAKPDDRFAITNAEWQATVSEAFTEQNGHLTLTKIPKKQKQIIIVLDRITQDLPTDQHWNEHDITAHLKTITSDPVTLRRYLIDYGFLSRTRDGADYWVTSPRKQ
ncbi:DUF2087 domain-containing protein [Furfurilactobacillus sp. WILCCON 0119]|uniref:DUF2087 domain-containing protein n=1 Tax=Furfurilactobacillus entadae TaxID=2922307 RepID=UPI0035EABCA2